MAPQKGDMQHGSAMIGSATEALHHRGNHHDGQSSTSVLLPLFFGLRQDQIRRRLQERLIDSPADVATNLEAMPKPQAFGPKP